MAGIAIQVTGVKETQQFMRRIARAIENSGPSDRKMAQRLIHNANVRIEGARKGDIATHRLGKSHSYQQMESGGEVVNNAVYAHVQQEGDTIVPVPPNTLLAIPLTKKLRKLQKWPSQFPRGAFEFIPQKSGEGGLLFPTANPWREATGIKKPKSTTAFERKLKQNAQAIARISKRKGKRYSAEAKQGYIANIRRHSEATRKTIQQRKRGEPAYVLEPSVTIPPMVEGGFLRIEEEDIDFYTNDILRRAGLET